MGALRSLKNRAFVALQYLLPQHAISRLVQRATRSNSVAFKNLLIQKFVDAYRPEMQDALLSDPLAYRSFNDFFTRALRPGARPIAARDDELISPVDGTVSEAGRIDGATVLQAKGRTYTLRALLAEQQPWVRQFFGGSFITIYLAPYNYHRIHMPWHGRLKAAWYIPGRLFSVNAVTAAAVPGLFTRNERVVCAFEQHGSPWALIMVGALNVGCIDTVWHGTVAPRSPRVVTSLGLEALAAPAELAKGAEAGRFNMGSTVVLLFPAGLVSLDASIRPGMSVRVGQRIGAIDAGGEGR